MVRVGSGGQERALRHAFARREDAERAAEAALRRSNRASGKIDIQLGGFWGDLLAEAEVDLKGVKPAFEGQWLITRVRHQLGRTLRTSFSAERDNKRAET